MQKKMTKNDSSSIGLVFLGASLASLASLAASTYFLFVTKDDKNIKQAKSWAIKMKGDIVEKLEKARSMTEPIYRKIIDSVAMNYERSKKLNSKEVRDLAQDLKKHWKILSNSTEAMKNDISKDSKKIIKKLRTEPKKLSAPKVKKVIKTKLVAPSKRVAKKVTTKINKINKKI